eukprot:5295991-Prymnesium_polylepis.1
MFWQAVQRRHPWGRRLRLVVGHGRAGRVRGVPSRLRALVLANGSRSGMQYIVDSDGAAQTYPAYLVQYVNKRTRTE